MTDQTVHVVSAVSIVKSEWGNQNRALMLIMHGSICYSK